MHLRARGRNNSVDSDSMIEESFEDYKRERLFRSRDIKSALSYKLLHLIYNYAAAAAANVQKGSRRRDILIFYMYTDLYLPLACYY